MKSVTKFCRYGERGKWCNLQHIDLHDLLDVLTMGFLLSIISIIRILVFSVGIYWKSLHSHKMMEPLTLSEVQCWYEQTLFSVVTLHFTNCVKWIDDKKLKLGYAQLSWRHILSKTYLKMQPHIHVHTFFSHLLTSSSLWCFTLVPLSTHLTPTH